MSGDGRETFSSFRPRRDSEERSPTGTPARTRRDERGDEGTPGGARVEDLRRRMAELETREREVREREGELNRRELDEEEHRRARRETGNSGSDRRSTLYTEGGTEVPSSQLPKLEKPEIYNGEYTVTYSVLNWIDTVEDYLESHSRLTEDRYSRYAATYMGKKVRMWYKNKFQRTKPAWDDLKEALKKRYLPGDHVLHVLKLYENTVQRGRPMEYVEKYQEVIVTVQTAGIEKSETEHILHFITGLREESDRRILLENTPVTLEDAYRRVMCLRQARTLARSENRGNPSTGKEYRAMEARLNMLEGKAKEHALQKGYCIGCGKPGHWVKFCTDPEVRKLKSLSTGTRTATGDKGDRGRSVSPGSSKTSRGRSVSPAGRSPSPGARHSGTSGTRVKNHFTRGNSPGVSRRVKRRGTPQTSQKVRFNASRTGVENEYEDEDELGTPEFDYGTAEDEISDPENRDAESSGEGD